MLKRMGRGIDEEGKRYWRGGGEVHVLKRKGRGIEEEEKRY